MNDKLRAALAEMLPHNSYSIPPTVEDLASMAAFFLRCVAGEMPNIRGKTTVEIISRAAWEIDKRFGYGVDEPDNRDGSGRKAGEGTHPRHH